MRWAALGLVALLGAVGGAVAAGDLRLHPVLDLALLALALAGFACLLRAVAKPGALLAGLLVVRAAALFGGPTLSEDEHRYVHEGRAQRLGLAVPYAVPPADIVPPPDDGTSARVNHKDVPAAYPPGVELVLLALVAVGDAVGHPRAPLRAALALADALVLVALFRRRKTAPRA